MKKLIIYSIGMTALSIYLLSLIFGLTLDLLFVTIAVAGIASAVVAYWKIISKWIDEHD